jgi:hypothetical protein
MDNPGYSFEEQLNMFRKWLCGLNLGEINRVALDVQKVLDYQADMLDRVHFENLVNNVLNN